MVKDLEPIIKFKTHYQFTNENYIYY